MAQAARIGTLARLSRSVRRQVARGVADRIGDAANGEAAERLSDELAERLDDPVLAEDIQTLPVEEVVRRMCRGLGLVAAALPPLASQSPRSSPASVHHRGSG